MIVAAPAGGPTGVEMRANVCETGKTLRRDTSKDASDGQKN